MFEDETTIKAIDMCRQGKIEYAIDGDIVICTKKYFNEKVDKRMLEALEYHCNHLESTIETIRKIVGK